MHIVKPFKTQDRAHFNTIVAKTILAIPRAPLRTNVNA